jgi:hypothetical protein
MEIKSYFENIRKIIISEIDKAEKEIIIAMAWFTNFDIFNILLSKLPKVSIRLIVLNDDINNRNNGLDFQEFIDKGGEFYYGVQNRPMHNKYCIIDEKVLISGSYNYTYLAESINYENIIVFKGPSDITDSYKSYFLNNLISNLKPIKSISQYLNDNPFIKDLFSSKNYGIKDLYHYAMELKENGSIEKAEIIIENCDTLYSNRNIDKNENFSISDVLYRQWNENYYLDLIQYFEDELILKFRTILDNGGGWIHGPKTNHCWLIRESENKSLFEKCNKITNIRANGKLLVTSTTEEKIFYFSNNEEEQIDTKTDLGYKTNSKNRPIKDNGKLIPIKWFKIEKGTELTCYIHFKGIELLNKTIDLIEGKDQDSKDNHWHCFDINMKLNRNIL